MAHGHDHHGGHHDHGGHHHHHNDHGGHHHHHPHHGHALPGPPVLVPVPYSYLPRTTVQYSYQLPTTTVGTPLLEPRQPSRALVGLLTCIFCFVVAVVLFVIWI